MRAVVIKEPYKVEVEDRPIPKVLEPTDVVVKNKLSALCGSDLHFYHGTQPVPHYNFVLGHEFVGEVFEVGSDVKEFKKGDLVVSPFTISW
jgi:threonine dehydrogenase-like Zn-dependent dehydrogenase